MSELIFGIDATRFGWIMAGIGGSSMLFKKKKAVLLQTAFFR